MGASESAGEITRLLRAHAEGDREAIDRLVPLVYDHLRAIARRQLARGGHPRTLDTTSLVHEAYMQLVDETGVAWQDRSHFFAICARAMRRILVDAARRRGAAKRGGGKPHLSLEPGLISVEEQTELVLAVDQALTRLASFNPRLERVVECRYFAGMTEDETAQALSISLRTVQREWTRARAWLQKELGQP
ncbi:MAG: ECF-type sigma factor [Thermoanaerobaculia bacterium]